MLGMGTDDSETETRSERHTPRPGTTLAVVVDVVPLPFSLQLDATQVPPRRTEVELEHARQLLGPAPEQLEQLLSHD